MVNRTQKNPKYYEKYVHELFMTVLATLCFSLKLVNTLYI